MPPLPWIKMWQEGLDDPKLTRLSLAERGAWWGILQLANKCEAEGKIESGGEGLNISEIADALHIKGAEDQQALESMISKMEKRKSLKWNEGVLTVVHYRERQSRPPSARAEAVRERVRRHREKMREPPIDTEALKRIALASRKKRKELGRDPTVDEMDNIKAQVEMELEKERG